MRHGAVAERHRADDAQVDDADRRDLRVGDLAPAPPRRRLRIRSSALRSPRGTRLLSAATMVNCRAARRSPVRRVAAVRRQPASPSGTGRSSSTSVGGHALEPARRGASAAARAGSAPRAQQPASPSSGAKMACASGPRRAQGGGQPLVRLAARGREAAQPGVEVQQVVASPRAASWRPAWRAARGWTGAAIAPRRRIGPSHTGSGERW